MATKYAQLIWECHTDSIREDSSEGLQHDLALHLWLMHSDTAANHVMGLLNAAHGGETSANILVASGDVLQLAEARTAFEDAITFLSTKAPYGDERTADDTQAQTLVRKAKAKLSFRAHMTCKGLGDVDSAIEYLKEAMKYEPETSESLLEKVRVLEAEGTSVVRDGYIEVVRWAADDTSTSHR